MDSSQIEFDIGFGDDNDASGAMAMGMGMGMMGVSSENCDHPINFGNMCGVCGVYLSDEQIANSAPMTHDGDGVKVSTQEAKRLDTESTAYLLTQRKLALVIDLDQTIIHATVDRSVGEFMNDSSNPNHEVLKDVGKFFLGVDGKEMRFQGDDEEEEHQNEVVGGDQDEGSSTGNGKEDESTRTQSLSKSKKRPKQKKEIDASIEAKIREATLQGGMWYYVKPRPHLNSFLETLSKKYQLHVYTMGTRSYADCVCKLIDKDGRFFGNRILSRDESGSIQRKSLSRLFADTSMVVAIDDRADVWEYSPNLVKVVPFSFFPATGDINGAFLPPVPEAPTGAPPTPPLPMETSKASESTSPANSELSSSNSSDDSSAASSSPSSSTSLGEEIPNAVGMQNSETAKQVQTQQIALNEQRENRPLARMQEAKDERLKSEGSNSTNSSSSSREGSSSSVSSQSAKEKPKSEDGDANSREEKGVSEHPKEESRAPEEKNMDVEEDEGNEDETSSSDSNTTVVNLNDIAATTRAVLSDDDRELDRLEKILLEIHSRWYLEWDSVESSRAKGKGTTEQEMLEAALRPKPRVEDIIGSLKSVVLRGCGIVFSSMWPLDTNPVSTEVWRMAEDFGAKCYLELNKAVTHVVAAKEFTEKVKLGQRHKSISVVWPTWFNESIASWSKAPEKDYLLPIPFEISSNKRTPSPLPEPPLISATEEAEDRLLIAALAADQEANDAFAFRADGLEKDAFGEEEMEENEGMADFAWDEAADEIDAFLSDDEEDEDTDGGYGTDASNRSRGRVKSVKRGRNSSGGLNSNHSRSTSGASTDNEEDKSSNSDKSPLSKRRRIAKSRLGLSKLKEGQTIHSGNESENGDDEDRSHRRRKTGGAQTSSEIGDEEDQMAASQDTDGSEIDQSFLRQLEDEMELELGEDEGDD